jgi:glycosyltransferase involved in cell wall biosynthesis
LKILHVISDLRRGGRERQLAVLNSFSNPEIEHHIIAFHTIRINYIEEYNLKINFVSKNKLKRFRDILSYAKEKKIDLIHTWGNPETIYSLPASLFLGIKLLNGSVRHGIRLNTFSHLFRSYIVRHSKYLVSNSAAGLRANKVKINNLRHFILYNGIEEKFFTSYNHKKRAALLSNYNLPENTVIFISIATFIPFKDYFTPLNALSTLKSEGINFFYIIVGWGRMESEIRNLIEKLNLSDRVQIFNEYPDIPDLLSISEIMIHSSLGEGCSNAILEAKSAGCVVVASDTGGTREIIGSRDLLFEYRNEEDLTSKIKTAIQAYNSDPRIREKIQEETREKFSVDNYYKNYIEIVKRIIK